MQLVNERWHSCVSDPHRSRCFPRMQRGNQRCHSNVGDQDRSVLLTLCFLWLQLISKCCHSKVGDQDRSVLLTVCFLLLQLIGKHCLRHDTRRYTLARWPLHRRIRSLHLVGSADGTTSRQSTPTTMMTLLPRPRPQLPARLPSSKHSTSKPQLTAVTKIWATADVIKGLKGQFAAYTQFKDVPRANQAAPDVKTWAGVQRWLWRLLPTSFSSDGDRVVCKPRQLTDSGDDAGRAPCRRDGHLAALAGIALAAHVWVLEARPPTDARSLALHSCEVFWQPRTYG